MSSYDEDSLKASTWKINGAVVILCCPCEDNLLKTIAQGRGLKIKYSTDTGGEIDSIIVTDPSIKIKRQ
jgi:hypothetical protein